jgi:hypothetical protein
MNPEPHGYPLGTEVTWERGDLPDGVGVIVEIKDYGGRNFYMVRDGVNAMYGFHEDYHPLKART